MSPAILEHINITVLDPESYAAKLCKIFDWHIRWSGSSMDNGHTVHIGSKDSYIALYTNNTSADKIRSSSSAYSELNHIAMTVEDLDAVEAKSSRQDLNPIITGIMNRDDAFIFMMKMDWNMKL